MKDYKHSTDVIFLRERIPWMGEHSGYDILYRYMNDIGQVNVRDVLVARNNNFLKRRTHFILSWCSSRINKLPYYDCNSMLAEVDVLCKLLLHSGHLVHIMYLEMDYGILAHLKNRLSAKIIGTSHQSPGWWRMVHRNPNVFSSLDALIVVSTAQKRFFEEYLPGRVYFIRHGVDTDFFKPTSLDNKIDSTHECHCVFSGHWMRDIQKLAAVISRVLERNRHIIFDLIVPRDRINDPNFYRIAHHEQVKWHSDISDSRLRDLYQQASLLFLPLIDCTANNALLESSACGLPIITTSVGGVRDYTDISFAEYFSLEDIEGMRDAILNLVDNKSEQQKRRSAARNYALKNLNWKRIALETFELYKVIQERN